MGMDVYGKNPANATGHYFRRNVWGWRPLAEFSRFACEVTDRMDLYDQCEHWHTNDGDGLDADGAMQLAVIIDRLLEVKNPDTGETIDGVQRFIDARDEALARMPNVPCNICGGTGIRDDELGHKMGQPQKAIPEDAPEWANAVEGSHPRAGQTGWCNGCNGRGYNRPMESWYSLDKEDVLEWRDFLRACGGFEIC